MSPSRETMRLLKDDRGSDWPHADSCMWACQSNATNGEEGGRSTLVDAAEPHYSTSVRILDSGAVAIE